MNPYKSPSKIKPTAKKSKSKKKLISPTKSINHFLEESHISTLHLSTGSIKSLNSSINTSLSAPVASSSQSNYLSTQRQHANMLRFL